MNFENLIIDSNFKYVFKCSWFSHKNYKKPYTVIYYEDVNNVKWIFDTNEWASGKVRVEYIKTYYGSTEYLIAEINDNKESKIYIGMDDDIEDGKFEDKIYYNI